MAEKDHSPLSVACVRLLNDRLYEKRKGAALEIEKIVREFVALNQVARIKKLLKVLGEDFASSHNLNTRKGGLIGLAATAIGLNKESTLYISELVKPVLSCFHDQDSGVRYYACEALYNIVKVARGVVLPYFNEIFDGLSKLAADPDQNVKNGTELLDRLIKDIVTESSSFDLVAFIPLLREHVYTRNPFARQFVVSWINVLDAVPDINMLVLLPEILDGLFQILGDTSNGIRKMCEGVLREFLQGIQNSKNGVNFAGMANILIVHSQSSDVLIQHTALTWLWEFVILSKRTMLPYASGIINSTLPCLAYEDDTRRISKVKEAAKSLNASLMKLVDSVDDQPSTQTNSEDITQKQPQEEEVAISSQNTEQISAVQLDIASVISVLCQMLTHTAIQTRIAALQWFCHLLLKIPNKTFQYIDDYFSLFLRTLSDPSDEVVLLDLEALAEISSNPAGQRKCVNTDQTSSASTCNNRPALNQYFTKFMLQLIELFRKDSTLLEDKGTFIIRQLAVSLNAEDIYTSLSEILKEEEDVNFACTMVQTLNTILLTSTELFELRNQLKELKTEESCSLFTCLYRSWCHSPVATVSLCYLTQNYQHACHLLQMFGDLEITKEFLMELDKLVQLIESPIFAYLRLQMLDAANNQHLLKSMYGLLMLLPQSEAFRILHVRLLCIPPFHLTSADDRKTNAKPEARTFVAKINFDELLTYFSTVQNRNRDARRRHNRFLTMRSIRN